MDEMPKRRRIGRYLFAALVLAGLVGLLVLARESGWLTRLTDQERLRETVENLGAFGPIAIILLLALAIVFSPIPSAPISLAAGAAYGTA